MLIRERKERQERQIQEIALGSARAENLLLSTVAETLQVDLFRRLRGPALVALGIVVGTVANIAATYNSLQHWVAAVVVDHRRVNETHDALREVVREAADAYDFDEDAELHGHELFGGLGTFAGLEPRQRIGIYAKAFRCLLECRCDIILRGVSVPGLRRRYGAR